MSLINCLEDYYLWVSPPLILLWYYHICKFCKLLIKSLVKHSEVSVPPILKLHLNIILCWLRLLHMLTIHLPKIHFNPF
jgi:hypothetical protein